MKRDMLFIIAPYKYHEKNEKACLLNEFTFYLNQADFFRSTDCVVGLSRDHDATEMLILSSVVESWCEQTT